MPLNETDLHLIDQFLTGRITEEEQRRLDERLQDADVQKELDWKKNTMPAIRQHGRETFKNHLKNLEQQLGSTMPTTAKGAAAILSSSTTGTPVKSLSKKTATRRFLPWVGVAASLVLLIGFVIYQNTSSVNEAALFAEYYQPYPNVVAPIVKGEADSLMLAGQGFQAYEKKAYDQAIHLLGNDDTEAARFYKALAHLGGGHTSQAIMLLEKITMDKDHRFQQPATWYLALAYLKDKQPEKAKILLEKIVGGNDHPFKRQAREIMRKL